MGQVTRDEVALGPARLSMLAAGTGQLVVLLHGTPSSAELWRDVLPLLAGSNLRAVAPDLPGYGSTRVPRKADHTLTGCADLIARWLDGTGSGPAWVVGHDLGGAVAQILAVRRGDLVSGLTLINSIADSTFPAPRARLATLAARVGLHRAMATLGMIPNNYMRRQVRRGSFHPSADTDAALDRIVWDGKFSSPDGRAAFERHLKAMQSRDLRRVAGDLGHIAAPCQLVWGVEDPFQRWEVEGRRLDELLHRPAVTLLRDCGHFVPVECPQRLAEAMLAWHRTSRTYREEDLSDLEHHGERIEDEQPK